MPDVKSRGKTLQSTLSKNPLITLPGSFWIHHHPHLRQLSKQFEYSTKTPSVRTRLMPAYNIYWVQPTQNIKIIDAKSTEYYCQGGPDENSYYVKQLNTPTPDAVAVVLCVGSTVYVSMLKAFHAIFDTFTKAQAEKCTPNKETAGKLTPSKIRGIVHRIAVQSGFSKGVTQCRCLPLSAWNDCIDKLYKKIPNQQKKAAQNPLDKITRLAKAFNDEYTTAAELYPDSSDALLFYENEMDALIKGCGALLANSGGILFRKALDILTYNKNEIKQKAAAFGLELKRTGATSTTEVDMSSSISLKAVQIQINHLKERVNDNAQRLINCPVTSPTEHVCKNMLEQPSAYIKYIGEENKPTFAELSQACGDKNGKKNDTMVMTLGGRAHNVWIACITLILSAHKKGIDCTKIMGENNAISSGNKVSGYDAAAHMGSIVHACTQGGYKPQQKTFSCQFTQVASFGDRRIKQYWKIISKELVEMVDLFFPNDTETAQTMITLQLNVGQPTKIRTLQRTAERRAYVQHLKWIFVLYVENLGNGEVPTVENFVSVILSPLGVSFCDAYLSWVATGYYRLKTKAHAKLNGDATVILPKHIKLPIKATAVSVSNTITGKSADDLFDVYEALVLAEWGNDQTIICTSQQNAKFFPLTHANSNLGRAAGAMSYWLIGTIRVVDAFAPRPGVLEQMSIYTKAEWVSIQPEQNFQKELRLGLSFITGDYGDIDYCHAHKTCGSGDEAVGLFDKKAARGSIRKAGQWSGTSTSGTWDFSGLSTTFLRFKEAADIIGGDPAFRKYLINVKDPLNNASNFKVMTSRIISSPAMKVYSKYHCSMLQAEDDPRTFKELMKPLEIVNAQGMAKHLPRLKELGITPCFRPPQGCKADHTLANGSSHSKTSQLIQKLFRTCIAPAIAEQKPIEMNKNWNLKSVKKPYGDIGTRGKVKGKILPSSVYTFKANNTAILSNLERFSHLNITQNKLDSVILNCKELAAGRMHLSVNFFGRQTNISRLVAVRACLRQIPDWDDGEAPDRRLNMAIVNMSKLELHEMYKIIKNHYLKVHETELGSPTMFFEHFDERIRAHPIQPRFSLSGIESWPDTTVPSTASTRNKELRPVQHAWTDVRNLTIAEQNLNMATLQAYKNSLQWIIDNQNMLREKDQGILRWFEERMNYDPMDIEMPVRVSPRTLKRKRKKKEITSM